MKKLFAISLSAMTILTCLSGCGNSLNGVVFKDTVVTYDGELHSIEASNLPSDVSVRYENNGFKDAGVYLVKAIFSKDNKDIKTKEAKLTIEPRAVTVNIDNKQSMIDDIQDLTYTVDGLIEGDDLKVNLSVDTYPGLPFITSGIRFTIVAHVSSTVAGRFTVIVVSGSPYTVHSFLSKSVSANTLPIHSYSKMIPSSVSVVTTALIPVASPALTVMPSVDELISSLCV